MEQRSEALAPVTGDVASEAETSCEVARRNITQENSAYAYMADFAGELDNYRPGSDEHKVTQT